MADLNLATAPKLVFLILLIGGSIMVGYGARRFGFPDRSARQLMYLVVLGPYSLVGFLALWQLDLTPRLASLPVLGFLLMGVGAAAGVGIARVLRMKGGEAGALAMACGASNIGFTMGGAVNFVLFGEDGLALASIYTATWNFGLVFLLYPVARHYGTTGREPIWRLLVANFVDIRSLPLLGVAVGLTLNIGEFQRPEFIDRYHIVTVLIVSGAFIAFFTTGLRLHFSSLAGNLKLYGLVAGVKFLLLPAMAGLFLGLLHLAGLGVSDTATRVVFVQASTAVGVYAVIISSLFHLDDKLAGILFFTNTVIYLVVILPLIVFLLG